MIKASENIFAIKIRPDAFNIFINKVGCLRYSYMSGTYEASEIDLKTESMLYDYKIKGYVVKKSDHSLEIDGNLHYDEVYNYDLFNIIPEFEKLVIVEKVL